MSISQQTLGIVIAGGCSSRMGRHKALLPHPTSTPANPVNLVQFALGELAFCCQHIACSLAQNNSGGLSELPAGAISDSIHLLHDRDASRGPAEAIAVSLDLANRTRLDRVLALAVDLPHVQRADLLLLLQQSTRSPERIVCAIDAESGRYQPLCAVYPMHYRTKIDQLAQSDHRSLYRFIQSQEHEIIAFPTRTLRNVNAPEDLLS